MAVYTAIDDPGSFYNGAIFTGTGSSLGVTGVGFQPDFTWIKNRDAADFHVLTDAVRGATKYLESNSTNAEVTNAESLKTFDSDGFTVGTMAQVNTNTEDYVSWNWKAGTTTGIVTTGSTITPTSYSFNATSGFSTIAYTGNGTSGALVPHGLGVVPTFIIVRELASSYWVVYHEFMGATKYMYLNEGDAIGTNVNKWNDTAPTSVLFSLGNSGEVNGSGDDYIAYCFTDVQGYSKFGSYVGNGNADGTFVYLSFQPAYVLVREIAADDWNVYDNRRPTFSNPTIGVLKPNSTETENTTAGYGVDFLANGFKFRGTNTGVNASGGDFFYAAFADQPFVNSNGVPCTAR